MGSITIKMLAKQLNLSTAAVSKALRDSHEISPVTKQRVLSLATELNYVPHPYAGSLREKRSKTIGVVLPEVADSFFSLALNGIETVAIENGYHSLIYLTHENLDREIEIMKNLEYGRVDGVIMSVSMKTSSYDHIKSIQQILPLVFFDRICEGINTAKVTTNDYECGYEVTKHLINQGCKRIALLSVSDSLSISSKRMQGYQQALADYGMDPECCRVIDFNEDLTKNHQLLTEVLRGKDRPDGIIATVSKMTTDLYLVCVELGIRIPQDLKVVCFSNDATAAILNPSLSTITQPAFEMGKMAAEILFRSLKKNFLITNEESAVIPSNFIIRNSSAG